MADDLTVIEIKALGRKLFGEQANLFACGGNCHVGRFLKTDDRHYRSGPNEGREISPWHRQQEVFGVGKTWREAFRFALGSERIYSIAGVAPGNHGAPGYFPVFDRYGRPIGWKSQAGIFHATFPSATIVTA